MKNMLFKGSLILIIAGLVGKVLGAIYRIPLSNILGAEGIGIYQMIFPVFSLALIICSGGVSITIAHKIAQIRASGNGNEKAIFFKGFFYSLFSSLFFALIFFFLGEQISNLQGNILASMGYKMVAITLVFSSLLASFRGLFQGYQNMVPTATSQILEQVFKVGFGLVFAYFFVGTSIELGVVGAFLGISIAEIIAFIYLVLTFRKHKFLKSETTNNNNFFIINLSITLGFLIIPIITAFDSFAVVNLLKNIYSESLATSLYGLQSGMINSLINFPVVISVAISLAILPDLSFLISQNNYKLVAEKISKVFNFLLLIILPCIVIFMFFSYDIMYVLYPSLTDNLLNTSSLLLKISAMQIIFISILQICTTIFQSLDKLLTPIYILSFAGVIKIILTLLLVPNASLNIYGLAISNLVFYTVAGLISVYLVKKKIPFSLKTKNLIVFSVSLISLIFAFVLINVYIQSLMAKIIYAGISFILLYIVPILAFDLFGINKYLKQKILKKREINNE